MPCVHICKLALAGVGAPRCSSLVASRGSASTALVSHRDLVTASAGGSIHPAKTGDLVAASAGGSIHPTKTGKRGQQLCSYLSIPTCQDPICDDLSFTVAKQAFCCVTHLLLPLLPLVSCIKVGIVNSYAPAFFARRWFRGSQEPCEAEPFSLYFRAIRVILTSA